MSSKARRILLVMHLPDREPLASVVRCIHLATGHSHSRLRCLQVLTVLEELVKCSPLVFIGSIPQSHQIRMSCCSRTADDAIQEIPLLLVSFGRRQLTGRHILCLCRLSSIGQSSWGSRRHWRGRHGQGLRRTRNFTTRCMCSLPNLSVNLCFQVQASASPILKNITYTHTWSNLVGIF